MNLLKYESKLVVVDSFLDDTARRLNPGDEGRACTFFPGEPRIYRCHRPIIIIEDEDNPGVTDSGRIVIVQFTDEKNGYENIINRLHIQPTICNIRNGNFQEVRELLPVFLPTFTKEQQHANPCILKPKRVIYSKNVKQDRHYWVYLDKVYSSQDQFNSEEVKAIVLEAENKKKTRVARALQKLGRQELGKPIRRETIPDHVKLFVWNRDGGKCVSCCSNRHLEYDHIIPWSLGGSNTARNLQLLCEECNRKKGANLF